MTNSRVKARDERAVATTRVRINGMARVDAVWRPIDSYGYEYASEFRKAARERYRTPTKWPAASWVAGHRYAQLSRTYKRAIDHYMSGHGTVLPHPDLRVVIGGVPSENMKMYLGEIASQQGYSGWDDFHEWYCSEVLTVDVDRGMPEGSTELWPVIISEFEDEGLQDGNHRLHQYMALGIEQIPFLVFTDEGERIKRVVEAWALRAEKVSLCLV